MPPIPFDSQWLNLVAEPILDPERPIIDPHHHLWVGRGNDYLLKQWCADTSSGHNIVKSVFIECHAQYDQQRPQHLQPVGETVFANKIAKQIDNMLGYAQLAGIVAYADLKLPATLLAEILDQHHQAAEGRFRGIRQAGAYLEDPSHLTIKPHQPAKIYADKDFRAGIKHLGQQGLSYDTWHYHKQNKDFYELAKACPDTLMVLDHFGTPLGVGPYANQRAEIFKQWKADVATIAQCPNVYAKLGGLAMPDNGFGWHLRDTPPSSDEIVQAHREYYLHMIECFGPQRCMFESNFPVDKCSLSYAILWNAFKKLTQDFSDSEKNALFYQTAATVYRI